MKSAYITIILLASLISGILLAGTLYTPPAFSITHAVSEGIDNVTVHPKDATLNITTVLLLAGLSIMSVGLIVTQFRIRHRRVEINSTSAENFEIPVLLCIMQLAFTIRLFFLSTGSFQSDESILTYTSYLTAQGFFPYKDVFLAQTPLSIYLMAAFIHLFGTSYPSVRVLNVGVFTGTIALTYFLSKNVLPENKPKYALAVTALYAFYPSWFVTVSFTSTLENLLTLFTLSTAITYVVYHKKAEGKYLVLSGFFSGCALATTLRAVYFLLPLVIFHLGYLFWTRQMNRLLKDGLRFVTGLIIPLGIMLIYFALNGALQSLYLDVIVYQVSLFPKGAFVQTVLWYLNNMWPLLVLGGLGIFATIQTIKQQGNIRVVFSCFILLSNVLFILSGVLSGGFFIHYLYYLLPFASIIAIVGVLKLKDSFTFNLRKRVGVILFLLLLVFSIGITGIYTITDTLTYFSQSPYDKVDSFIAQSIENITLSSTPIWSSEAAIGFFSDRMIVAPSSDFRFIGMFDSMIGFNFGVDKGSQMKGYANGFVGPDDFVKSWKNDNVSVLVFIINKGWVPYPDPLLWSGYRNQTGVAGYVTSNYMLTEIVTCDGNPYSYYIWVRKG